MGLDLGGSTSKLSALADALVNGGLRAGWRAATSDGQGVFLASMLLFGIAAYSFHYGLVPQTKREHRLEQAAKARQESLEGERYPILASLVSPRELVPIVCRPEAGPLRGALKTSYAAFAVKASAIYQDVAQRRTQTPDFWDTLLGDFYRPAYALDPVCGSRTINIGPAWSEDPAGADKPQSTLFIPSTLALRANMACPDVCSPHTECMSKATDVLSGEFDQVISVSKAIESIDYKAVTDGLVAALKNMSHEPPNASMYFISPEGITRTRPTFTAEEALAHYMSNGASYFSGALQRVGVTDACRGMRAPVTAADKPVATADQIDGFVTYPYLDMFGSGLVETYCKPIDVTHDGRPGRKSTVGVLCTDIRHPEAEVLQGLLDASDALDLTVVRLWEPNASGDGRGEPAETVGAAPQPRSSGPGDRWVRSLAVTPCEQMDLPGGCPRELETFGDWSELRLFAAVYYNNTLNNKHSLRPGAVFVDGRSDDLKFGVAVYRGDRYWDVAIGKLREPRRRDYAALVFSGVCVVISIVILAIGYRHKMLRREAYLARGLAYGLVQLGANDNIIGANDRAEAILNTGLPRLGIYQPSGNTRNTFSGFIEYKRCVVIPIAGALNKRCVVNYDQIRRRSIDGLTTDFYAYLKSKTWIRVSTRIVMLPDKQEDLFYALDSQISAEHASFLESLHG